ncbi:MAG TPA: RagB/SusD family nutrient uptake outer membrane protein [Ohtaekwangia sp.]
MNKNLKKFLYGALLLTGVFACSDLEEEPWGIINPNSFYKTAADAESAIVYCYAILPEVGYYSRGYYIVTELPTENLTQKGDAGTSNFELDELRTTATNSNLDDMWTYIYRGISRANGVITNVPNIAMNETTRDQIVGEAYFLRGLHYFNLVRMFGQVPLRLKVIDNPAEIPQAKASLSEVYALIIADLKQAEELITVNKISEGRANRVAAQGLLAKVYLHLASSKASNSPGYDFVTNADEMYAEALTYSGKVINDQDTYDFTDVLVDIWDIEVYKKSAVNEHIFDAAVDRSGDREGSFSKLPNMFLPADRPMYILANPSDEESDTINIGQGWSHFRTEDNVYNSYEGTDKRKTDLIVSKYWNDGAEYTLDINSSSRPFTRKFIDPKRIGDASSCNSPIVRYSDILLIYAEANGPNAEGYDAINKIRARADVGDLAPGLDVTAFRKAVIEERARELTFEGDRLFDLRRTNTMEEILVIKYGKTITSGAYFFPVPQREIDTNPLMTP